MKRIRLALIMMLFLTAVLPFEAAPALAAASAQASSFDDVDASDPNAPYIEELFAKQLVDGIAEHRFGPNDLLNREQFAKMLVTAFRIPTGEDKLPFTDVTDDWAKPYVAAAYKAKVIQGMTDTEFAPLASLTKQTAATIVYRWMDAQGIRFVPGSLSAAIPDTDDWAKDGVAFVLGHGLRAEGVSTAAYDSKKSMTRGEAAALIALSIRKLEGRSALTPQKPDNSGANQEQAITMQTPGIMNDIPLSTETWIKTHLKAGTTAIIDAPGAATITIRDSKGQYMLSKSVSSFRYEPLTEDDYYLILTTDRMKSGKSLSLSIIDGSSFEGAYPLTWSEGKAVLDDIRIPAKGSAFFSVDLSEGLPYMIKAKAYGNIDSMELFDPLQKSAATNSAPLLSYTAKQNGRYIVKVNVSTDSTVELFLSPEGGSEAAAIPISPGTKQIHALPDGTVWLTFSPQYGRYLHMQIDGATAALVTKSNNFGGSFAKKKDSLVMDSHYPLRASASFANTDVYVKVTAASNAEINIRYEDGATPQTAFSLSLTDSSINAFPVYRTYRDESFYFQVNLIGGVNYQLKLVEGKNEFKPEWINMQLDFKRFSSESPTSSSTAVEAKLKVVDSDKRELQTLSGRMPVFRPLQDGTYYLQLYPGSSDNGYLLSIVKQ